MDGGHQSDAIKTNRVSSDVAACSVVLSHRSMRGMLLSLCILTSVELRPHSDTVDILRRPIIHRIIIIIALLCCNICWKSWSLGI